MKKQATGFTLLELIVTIAIIGVLSTIAAPSFSRMMAKNRLNNFVSEWRSAFYLAQKEAIRTKKEIFLCGSSDGANCTSHSNYSEGWIVTDKEQGGKIIRDYPRMTGNNLSLTVGLANGAKLKFSHSGRLSDQIQGANLTAINSKYPEDKLELNISRAGSITRKSK